jgi:predicted amidohydrolase
MKTYKAYVDRMQAFVASAVNQGAGLVCFPEENGLLAMGQLPFAGRILKFASRQMQAAEAAIKQTAPPEADGKHLDCNVPLGSAQSAQAEQGKPPSGLDPLHLLSIFTPFIRTTFETTFSELAKAYRVYIMAGSAMLVDEGRLYNRAYLFGPQGEIVGTQDKIHPIEMELDLGMSFGTHLKVFATPLGRLAFPVCMDATYFETFKILKHMGAQIVIIPIANMEPFDLYLSLRGIWPRVQEAGIYGLKSALVGDLYAFKFTGKAGAYAPLELTPQRNGVLAEAGSYDRDAVVMASLDLPRLDEYQSPYFSDTNPELYRHYLPDAYTATH